MTNNLSDFHKKIHANYIFHVLQRKSGFTVHYTSYKERFSRKTAGGLEKICVFFIQGIKSMRAKGEQIF